MDQSWPHVTGITYVIRRCHTVILAALAAGTSVTDLSALDADWSCVCCSFLRRDVVVLVKKFDKAVSISAAFIAAKFHLVRCRGTWICGASNRDCKN